MVYYIPVMEEVKKINLTVYRKKIHLLDKERRQYIFKLLHGKQMVQGIPYKIFKKCGNKNCKCNKGELHGPYPALSVCKNGKQRIVMIRKEDIMKILPEAKRYKRYQQVVAKIRKINKEIDKILEEVKHKSTRSYP